MPCRGAVVRALSWGWFAAAMAVSLALEARAQTTTNGSSLALRSYLSSNASTNFGNDSGIDAILNTNGYVGTYITLAAPGSVMFTVNASGQTNDSTLPELGIAVDDSLTKFNVAGGFGNYGTSVSLPAGTHFVRVQYGNDKDVDPINGNNHSLTVRNLQVTGATVLNSPPDFNQTALDAANNYITNYRKGPATIKLLGATPGTSVQVDMTRSAFNFGGTVSGVSA